MALIRYKLSAMFRRFFVFVKDSSIVRSAFLLASEWSEIRCRFFCLQALEGEFME